MKRLLTRMQSHAQRLYRAFRLLVVFAPACSELVNVQPDQCSSQADCDQFGPEYACVAGLCEAPEVAGGGGESAGAGGEIADARGGGAAGHADAGSVGGDGNERGGEAGIHASGSGGAVPEGGTAGDGGHSGAPVITEPPCESHKECFDRRSEE